MSAKTATMATVTLCFGLSYFIVTFPVLAIRGLGVPPVPTILNSVFFSSSITFTCFLQCSSYNTPLYDLPIDAAINQDLMDTGKERFME
jgi:hypothetical protein